MEIDALVDQGIEGPALCGYHSSVGWYRYLKIG